MLVHRSNSLEELARQLHRVVSAPGPGLLEPEVVLIQSAGMERWLSRELSRRQGIAANLRFPYPRAFLRQVLDAALGEEPAAMQFEREVLTWHVDEWLGRLPAGEIFEPVRRNLRGDDTGHQRLLLAQRLAYLLDQYLTYRRSMILHWQEGGDPDDFQSHLWRHLVDKLGQHHLVARCERFVNEATDQELARVLPSRVSLVGGPGLPPLFLGLLARIAQVVPVHLFAFSVCREYIADVHPEGEEFPEIGAGVHPLLASSGKLGGDFQQVLEEIGTYQEGAAEFRLPSGASVLETLQRDIVEGLKRQGSDRLPETTLDPRGRLADQSVRVDSCHSRLREVETLRERVLGWLAADPSLRPEDIVVLCPQIEDYSPLVSAVFGERGTDAQGRPLRAAIPHRIADRSEGASNPGARSFVMALRLALGRFKASQVLDLLQTEPVAARFGIDAPGLERLREWVSESGIRWGVDGAHRAELGLPADERNTWRSGLTRLLLGYARADEGDALLDGVVPFDDVPAAHAELLGQFAEVVERLTLFRRQFSRGGPLTPETGRELLLDLARDLLAESPEGRWDVDVVRQSIHQVFERLVQAGSDRSLGPESILHLIETELDERKSSTDFLTGGITFCALLPLRTIPFRIVCVLGLNQGEFPRTERPHELDRMARRPLPGDRSMRSDDRYLFLEILLSARERLSLSYVGRSVQDNSERPPSVLLEELSRVVGDMIEPASGLGEHAPLAPYQHPLQPFSPRYFERSADGLQSFDRDAYLGALALAGVPPETGNGDQPARTEAFAEKSARLIAPFVSGPLRAPASQAADQESTSVSWAAESAPGGLGNRSLIEVPLAELVNFWKDPAAAFLGALGVVIRDEIESFEDREPVALDALERHVVGQRWVEAMLAERQPRIAALLARGHLPVGVGGEVASRELVSSAEAIVAVGQSFRQGAPHPPRAVEVSLGRLAPGAAEASTPSWAPEAPDPAPEIILTGSIEHVFGTQRIEVTYGRIGLSRQLKLWIEHLAACAAGLLVERSVFVGRAPSGANRVSVQEPAAVAFGRVPRDQAQGWLRALALARFRGLREPSPCNPAAAEALWGHLTKCQERNAVAWQEGWSKAEKALVPRDAESRQRRMNAVLEQVFRGDPPLGVDRRQLAGLSDAEIVAALEQSRFAREAELLCRPMQEARESVPILARALQPEAAT